jgi:hypothetical protein
MLKEGADLRTWVREGLDLQPQWWRDVARWPAERQELWTERASIMAVDGGLSRHEAEQQAFALLATQGGKSKVLDHTA